MKKLWALIFLINYCMLNSSAQISLKNKHGYDISVILYRIEGLTTNPVDTFSISNHQTIQINELPVNSIYNLALMDKSADFLFALEEKKQEILLNSNFSESKVSNSPLNDQLHSFNRTLKHLKISLDSLYQLQAAAIGSNNINKYHQISQLAEGVNQKISILVEEQITNEPESMLSQILYISNYKHLAEDKIIHLFAKLKQHNNLTWFSPRLYKLLTKMENTQVGKKLPVNMLVCADGSELDFSKNREKKQIMIISASWCLPCKDLIKDLKLQFDKLKLDTNYDVLILMMEENDEGIKKANKEMAELPKQWKYIVSVEADLPLMENFSIGVYPTLVLIDKEGFIDAIIKGYIKAELDGLLWNTGTTIR